MIDIVCMVICICALHERWVYALCWVPAWTFSYMWRHQRKPTLWRSKHCYHR